MIFIGMMDIFLWMAVRLEKGIWLEKITSLFNKFGLKLDIQTNLKISDFFDITLNLYGGTISLFFFLKNNQYSSTNSLNIHIFTQNEHEYKRVLKIGCKCRDEAAVIRIETTEKDIFMIYHTLPYGRS